MNFVAPQFNQISSNSSDFENIELDNNMTFTPFDDNHSTEQQNYLDLNQTNLSNYFISKRMTTKNTNNAKNKRSCSLVFSQNTNQSDDIFYAFNILPINLGYLSGQSKFSFLSELNRAVDICEMSTDTKAVHVNYQNITITPQKLNMLYNQNVNDKNVNFINKLQQAAQFSNNLNNQINYGEQQQLSFNQRSKKVINNYFLSKKDKRMFALSSSFNPNTSKQSFSVHFSSEMIKTLGFETDSFMLKCSIVGFNEFMMKNDFISNMDSIIEGFANQIVSSTQSDPIKIKQKFCKNQNEAMEAVFAVYMLKDPSIQAGAESIIVFEIQHILDFQVSTKGKKFITKKRQFDTYESYFLERYSKSLNQQNFNQHSDNSFDETSGESGQDSSQRSGNPMRKRKGIQKLTKLNENKQQSKRRYRKSKDLISQ